MKKISFLFTAISAFTAMTALATVRLPAVFSDHMVLQRDVAIPVWGWSDPREKVTVEFAGQRNSVEADAQGHWLIKLESQPANSEAGELKVTGKDSNVKITDVLVGDVWLAGGQSNMEFPLNSTYNAPQVLSQADDPQLRFFIVKPRPAAEPQTNCDTKWAAATPLTAKYFSGVAYFFAREIRHDQKVPVGVLEATWGGTDIESWMSLTGLRQNPTLTNTMARWDKAVADHEKIKSTPELITNFESDLKQWQAEVAPVYNAALKKYNEDKAAGKEVGAAPNPSRPQPINPDPLGMPGPAHRNNTPTVNFNGQIAPLVPYAVRGVIWYQGENNSKRGLEYRELFPRLIQDWRSQWARSPAAFPFLFVQLPGNGPDPTPVADQGWPWLREAQLMTLKVPATGMAITIDVGDPKNVHPTDKLNVGQRLALVARKLVYGENVVASGPLFQGFKIQEDGKVRLHFSETGGGLVIGQAPWCAPDVKPFPTDKLIGFFIAGADRQWVEAEASIDGDSVVVSSSRVAKPVAVRYGWANSPRCNLYNNEKLPASPFRTDDWPENAGKNK